VVTGAANESCTPEVDISDDAWTAVLLPAPQCGRDGFPHVWLGAVVVGVGKQL
jgi:hypothetical protein